MNSGILLMCTIKLSSPDPGWSGASKGFMKALKAFIKPFEAPQRSVTIKMLKLIFILIQLSETEWAGRVNIIS